MSEKGRLIGIGVGPGDSELLTMKANRILKEVPVIFAPKPSAQKESIALKIVRPVLESRDDYNKLMLVEPVFPMVEDEEVLEEAWNKAAFLLSNYLDTGRDVAFVTLGDPSIFSTFSYVQKRLKEDYEVEVVPGITSFTACAASLNKPLVEKNEILTVVPKIDDRLNDILNTSDSVVLMKASRNPKKLEEEINKNDKKKEIYSVQNCTKENEKIVKGFSEEKPYMTTTIVKLENDE